MSGMILVVRALSSRRLFSSTSRWTFIRRPATHYIIHHGQALMHEKILIFRKIFWSRDQNNEDKSQKTVRRNPSRSSRLFNNLHHQPRKKFYFPGSAQVEKRPASQYANRKWYPVSFVCSFPFACFPLPPKRFRRLRRKRFLKVFFWYHFECVLPV